MCRRYIITLLLITPVLYAQDPDSGDASLESLLQIPITAAAKHWQTIEEAPASVSIITSSQIERFGYRTLEDVLRTVRGFYISNDRNYTYLGVRGFGRPTDYNNRVLLLINGHTTNENVYGSSAIGTDFAMPLDVIDRIEIVRGPGSALYGTSAMFAVINIVTKKGIAVDGFRANASTGSFGLYEGSLMWGKEYKSGFDMLFSANISDSQGENVYFSEFDTDSTNNGVARDLDWDQYWSVFTTMSYGDFRLQARTTQRKKGFSTGSWGTTFNDPSAYTLDKLQIVELLWNRSLSSTNELTIRGYYDRYGYEGTYPYDSPLYDGTVGTWVGTEVRLQSDPAPNNRMIAGFEYQRHLRADYRMWYAGEYLFDGNYPYSIFSLYVQNEFQPTAYLSLTAGIRYDSYSTFGGTTNPRGAVIYNPAKGSTIKLLYGRAFRAPNIFEVYYTNSLDGYKQSSGLKPETIRTAELVWEQRLSDQFFSVVSLYDYRMNNLIDQQVDETDSLIQFKNVNEVKARGLELELNFRFPGELRGSLSYATQKAETDPNGVTLTNSPQHLVKAGVSFQLSYQFETSVEAVYESTRKTVYDTQTGDYLLTNLSLRSPLLFEKIQCSFTVKNVFDVEYKLPGGLEHIQDAIVQPGRTFLIKAGIRL